MHMARPNDWLSVEDQYVWWHAEPVTHALVPQQHIEMTSNSGPLALASVGWFATMKAWLCSPQIFPRPFCEPLQMRPQSLVLGS